MNTVGKVCWTLVALALTLLVGAITTCTVTGIQRDRAFENACRKAGGFIGHASTVSAGSAAASNAEVCLEVVEAPVAKPIPLPAYTP